MHPLTILTQMDCITGPGFSSAKGRIGSLRPLRRNSYNCWAGGTNSSGCVPQSCSCHASIPTASIRSIGSAIRPSSFSSPLIRLFYRYNNILNSSSTAPLLHLTSPFSGSCNLSTTRHRRSSRISRCMNFPPLCHIHPWMRI